MITILMYKNINSLFVYGRSKWFREREREREKERKRERERENQDCLGNTRLQLIFRFTAGGNVSPESFASSCFFDGRLIQGCLSTRGHRPSPTPG